MLGSLCRCIGGLQSLAKSDCLIGLLLRAIKCYTHLCRNPMFQTDACHRRVWVADIVHCQSIAPPHSCDTGFSVSKHKHMFQVWRRFIFADIHYFKTSFVEPRLEMIAFKWQKIEYVAFDPWMQLHNKTTFWDFDWTPQGAAGPPLPQGPPQHWFS